MVSITHLLTTIFFSLFCSQVFWISCFSFQTIPVCNRGRHLLHPTQEIVWFILSAHCYSMSIQSLNVSTGCVICTFTVLYCKDDVYLVYYNIPVGCIWMPDKPDIFSEYERIVTMMLIFCQNVYQNKQTCD